MERGALSDFEIMSLALDEARKCEAKVSAFSVGCILVAKMPHVEPVILSRGYSRELPGNTHAEANALQKARELQEGQLKAICHIDADDGKVVSIEDILRHTDVYTTLEPCSTRTSGLPSCADALISAGVSRCVIGVGEPDDFVQCEGAAKLQQAGIRVEWLKGLEEECLKVARTGHDKEN